MINALHLLWIIPVIGFMICAILTMGKDEKNNNLEG